MPGSARASGPQPPATLRRHANRPVLAHAQFRGGTTARDDRSGERGPHLAPPARSASRSKAGSSTSVPTCLPAENSSRRPGRSVSTISMATSSGLDLGPGTLAFTTCQVPVVVHRSAPPRVQVTFADGSSREVEGLSLDAETSAAIFGRTGVVKRLEVFFGLDGGTTDNEKDRQRDKASFAGRGQTTQGRHNVVLGGPRVDRAET